MEKRKYYRGLDILRGISALLVMLYHYTARYNEVAFTPPHLQTNWAINLPWASMAVVTFFLLSGFLCNAYGEEKPFKYVGKRLLRLYPAFLTALICTSLVTFFFCRPAFAGFKNIILNLTMLPGLLGARVVDGVYWTLQYEIIFFVIIGALFFLKKKMLKKGIFIAWLVLGIAVAFLRKFDNIFISAAKVLLILNYIQTFILGISLKEIADKKQDVWTYITIALCFVNHYLWQGWLSALWLFISALFILYVTAIKPDGILNKDNKFTKCFSWLAGISYALYLVHQVIGYVIIQRMVSIGWTNELFIFIPIAVSILLAWLIHQFIEKPIFAKLKKKKKEE